MRVCLDACVLYPSVVREMLLASAGQGLFEPFWSARILEEWRRAAARLGAEEATQAEAEIALLKGFWPDALLPEAAEDPALWLPDRGDIHVLATAIQAGAESIITFNLRDFPARELSPHGLKAIHPDRFFIELWRTHPELITLAADHVLGKARDLGDPSWTLPALMKKARLPRLGKTLGWQDRAE